MAVLGMSKIARNGPGGRITLNTEALAVLKARHGDLVMITTTDSGQLCISKIES